MIEWGHTAFPTEAKRSEEGNQTIIKPTTEIAAHRYAVDKWSSRHIFEAAEHLKNTVSLLIIGGC